jgi:hypothetical protein
MPDRIGCTARQGRREAGSTGAAAVLDDNNGVKSGEAGREMPRR